MGNGLQEYYNISVKEMSSMPQEEFLLQYFKLILESILGIPPSPVIFYAISEEERKKLEEKRQEAERRKFLFNFAHKDFKTASDIQLIPYLNPDTGKKGYSLRTVHYDSERGKSWHNDWVIF